MEPLQPSAKTSEFDMQPTAGQPSNMDDFGGLDTSQHVTDQEPIDLLDQVPVMEPVIGESNLLGSDEQVVDVADVKIESGVEFPADPITASEQSLHNDVVLDDSSSNDMMPQVPSFAGFDGTAPVQSSDQTLLDGTSQEQPLFDGAAPEGLPDPQEPGSNPIMINEQDDAQIQVPIYVQTIGMGFVKCQVIRLCLLNEIISYI